MRSLIHNDIIIHMSGETKCSAGSVGMTDRIHGDTDRDNNVERGVNVHSAL